MQEFLDLLSVAKRKATFDETNRWYQGSETYLSEIKNEIDEVVNEIPKNRVCYLEDELGDVLWDYLNILMSLEKEVGITVESVITRAVKKYSERISGIENGEQWNAIKAKQKLLLAEEHSTQQGA